MDKFIFIWIDVLVHGLSVFAFFRLMRCSKDANLIKRVNLVIYLYQSLPRSQVLCYSVRGSSGGTLPGSCSTLFIPLCGHSDCKNSFNSCYYQVLVNQYVLIQWHKCICIYVCPATDFLGTLFFYCKISFLLFMKKKNIIWI